MHEEIKISVDIFIEPDGDGFHAYSPALKGVHAPGDTEDEALKNVKDAVVAYLISLIKHDEPIPISLITNPEEFCFQGLKPNIYKESVSVPARV